MKRLRQFSPIHKSGSIVRRYISHFILGLLTLFLITAVVPVAAQRSPITSIEQHTTHASTQLAQGITLYEAGQIADAAAVWQQAAQDYEVKGDRLNQALSLNYLSLAYQDLGQWQKAQSSISQSLELIPPNNPFTLAQVLNTQGSLQLALGKAEAALNTWKQAEQAYRAAGDEVGMIGTQINQSQALQTLGLYRRAKTNLEQINQKLQTQPDSLLKASGLRSLGVALQVVGDLQQSQEVLEQSLAIQERLDSAGDTSATLFSLGNTRRALQDYPKATELYQKAAEKATNPLSQLEAQLNQLSLLVQTEQWQAAQALLPTIQANLTQLPPSRAAVYAQVNLAESLIKLSALTGKVERDPKALPSSTVLPDMAQLLAKAVQQARMLKDSRAESYALGELAHLYEYTQNFPEAQKLTQDALSLAQAINASDITYRWQWQLGRIHKHQGALQGGLTQPHTVQALAAYTEAVKALQSLRSDLVAINPDVQFSFRESVEPIYRELVELLLQSVPEQNPVSRQENLKQARQVIESLQLAELDNFFREACLDIKPEQIDRVDPTAAVIYPIILPDRFAVILSLPGQPLSYYQTQLRQSEVEGILEQFLQSLNRSFSSKLRLRFSQQVYDWLIRPAEARLAESGVKTLVFVLDGSLRNVPMAALHDGKQYLVEKYSIALSQGLQLLESRSLARNRLTALTGGLTEARQGFAALPGVKSELKQISAEVRSEVLLNQEFTQKSLEKKISALPFPVIHLATHAQFSSKAEDTFLLTWDGRIQVKDFDQLLQSRQQQNQNPIELLVLSACQTAAGDKRATLGLAGLAVRSGARSTLATLWSVSDESTAEFMAEFYRELFQTQVSKAEAVRQSQLMLLRNAKYDHPYYWAPFVLVGNWL
ncbi:CHAT domain-containing protein [Allocoleopsis franciscana]|uniref:CHAT domain-containing protein n=1 Tax=Allocoleopsis franciscana PCC 7113 TaxID=1173027 RepID=K9WQD2_9CYAN|nr:CHAT domain-containing protein [Allocoleopsis franciscana]AFZ21767.1 hypothetical protein Mic7113_6175 [Allocoleopsis franciscana PCC 7113]